MLSRSCGQREGGHRRVNERAAETRTPHQPSKAENTSHRGVSRERPVRLHAPARRPDRFRKSLYVNEEASYREASFVDCDGQFTSTSRTLSIAIVSPKTICPGRPQATNGIEKSLAILRRAVNPRIARRPSWSVIPGAAARLHGLTSSLRPLGKLLGKHVADRRGMQAPSRAYSTNPRKAGAPAPALTDGQAGWIGVAGKMSSAIPSATLTAASLTASRVRWV